MKKLNEFEIINKYFAPLTYKEQGAYNLKDDVAVLPIFEKGNWVITTDSLVADVHFFQNDPADLIARKMLRVNLSDLASKGAQPLYYLMTLALPHSIQESWIADFAEGLAQDQEQYNVSLIGGDTVATHGPITLSVTALGLHNGYMIPRRDKAKIDDLIVVSGTVGDSALGLMILKKKLIYSLDKQDKDYLVNKYKLPQPQIELGLIMSADNLCSSCLDISDGFIADLNHLCQQSNVGAVIYEKLLPVSQAAQFVLKENPSLLMTMLSGGDDYELLFTISKEKYDLFLKQIKNKNISLTIVGKITNDRTISIIDQNGKMLPYHKMGYQHF
ncbi:MAG: thiamine-phosphate kinase [Alphaproteobacteria bacterium]|nr:thiamine-phosphate kinase [Alphaproteobacteria bacterium]